MKAIVYDRYGSFEVLSLCDIAQPTIERDEVLVRVHAAGLHIGDCFGVHGAPFAMRAVSGFLRPKYGVPGFDLAGTVEAIGPDVTSCKPGDEVFGAGFGTCAEYARVKQATLAPKPRSLSFAQAAAIPTSGLAALAAIRDTAKLQAGRKLLVNGAAGGVGLFAVQIAKSLGAHGTGVCSSKSVELVRKSGADHAIDYASQDFTQGPARYEVILDNIENRSLSDIRRVLTPKGMLILNSGTGATGLAMMVRLLRPLVLNLFVSQHLRRFLSKPNRADLLTLAELADAGQLTPILDQTFPLSETRATLAHVESGLAHGKAVVTL